MMVDNKDRLRWLHKSIDECLFTLERTKSQVKLLHREVEIIEQINNENEKEVDKL